MTKKLPGAPKRKPRAPKVDTSGLTAKEDAFVLNLIGACNWNGKAAAIAAGFSPENAKSYAHQLLQKPKIIAAVTRAMEARNRDLAIDARYVLARLVGIEMDAASLGINVQALRLRRDTLESIGKHVDVRAFRTQIGLGNPDGGPVESVDLSQLSAEELDAYGRLARKLQGGDADEEDEVPA